MLEKVVNYDSSYFSFFRACKYRNDLLKVQPYSFLIFTNLEAGKFIRLVFSVMVYYSLSIKSKSVYAFSK